MNIEISDKRLSSRQRAFCKEYLLDKNATASAIRAGYSVSSAPTAGNHNLTKPYIKAYIQQLQAECTIDNSYTRQMAIDDLEKIRSRALQKGNFTQAVSTQQLLGAITGSDKKPVTTIPVKYIEESFFKDFHSSEPHLDAAQLKERFDVMLKMVEKCTDDNTELKENELGILFAPLRPMERGRYHKNVKLIERKRDYRELMISHHEGNKWIM